MELKVPTVVRWYRYWEEKGGFLYGRENFCHFVRTVFFYAPARWFFFARRAKIVAPWSVTLLLTLSTLFWLWPVITAICVGVLTVIVGIASLMSYFSDDIEEFAGATAESAGPLFTFKVIGNLPAWFFLISTLIGLCLFFLPDFTFPALMVVFVAVVWMDLLIGALFGLSELSDYLRCRMANWLQAERRPSKIGEFLKIIGAYLHALKKGVCPFIEIKENSIVFYWE